MLHVRKSEIHGKGVFARKCFKVGDIILPIEGKLRVLIVKNKRDSLSHPNWIGVGRNQWIDPTEPLRSINHSCSPNVGAITTARESMHIAAMKNLVEGEELLIDYSTIEGDPMWEMKCHCKASNCRGIIRSVISIPKEQFEEYKPYVLEYFKELYARESRA